LVSIEKRQQKNECSELLIKLNIIIIIYDLVV
jgi:hypothetical protein